MLREVDIPEIRRMYRDGFMYKEIATTFECSEEAIRHVLIGKTWSHIPDPDGPLVMRRKGPASDACRLTKLDWATVDAIRKGHAAGRSYRKLGDEFGVNYCTVRDIVKRRTHGATLKPTPPLPCSSDVSPIVANHGKTRVNRIEASTRTIGTMAPTN